MISVVMAAYNGGEYIAQQLDSVLHQLGEEDEVIISDDLPLGSTANALKPYLEADKRIKYINGPQKGVIKNFENAIVHANGDFIFLCDQDDVWLDGKVKAVIKEFENGAVVVMHNAKVTDENLKVVADSFFDLQKTGTGCTKNIIKNTYIGCCMAFSAKLKPHIIPFPEKIPMHDQWIGLMGERAGKISLIKTPYILYRRHGEAVTGGRTSLLQKIRWRASIICCLFGKQVNL